MFECDAAGCETKIERENGLCKYHIGRYIESKKNGGPVFLRKSQGHGKPLTPALSPKGRGRKKTEKAEMKCKRCEKSSGGDKRFSRKKGLCNSCSVMTSQYKKAGKELPPARKKIKEASDSGEGTASLKKGKIFGAKKPLVPPSPAKEREEKKVKRAKKQISPGDPFEARPPLKDLILTLDFSNYESLLEVIRVEAENDFRTPEMQALFIIKEALGT